MSKPKESTAKLEQIIKEEKKLRDYISKLNYGKSIPKPKYFLTFPYPYMNGILHLGHAYTLIKPDIIARFKRLMGYNVLFPFAFHGSGTPIVSCADKVRKELQLNQDDLTDKSQIMILRKMGIDTSEI